MEYEDRISGLGFRVLMSGFEVRCRGQGSHMRQRALGRACKALHRVETETRRAPTASQVPFSGGRDWEVGVRVKEVGGRWSGAGGGV